MLITGFIQKNPNWEQLLSNAPYFLKIKRKNNLILFNYSQIDSDPSNEIVKEARGLILEDKTFKPVCFGFKRFYNIDEPNAAKIDWKTATASSKEDGALFFLYYYNNSWHVKTRSTFDAIEASLQNGQFSNFEELFNYLLSFYPTFSFENLNKNYVYCLEGCSDFNRVVIPYKNPQLFHLMTRDMITLREIETEIGIPHPKKYNLNSEKEYRELVSQMGEGHEGIVVLDAQGNRVKIKTELYFQLHHLANNGVMTLERAVELVLANDYEEFLSYFPHYTGFFDFVVSQVNAAMAVVGQVRGEVSNWVLRFGTDNRKDFAIAVKDSPYSALYFAALDGKLDSFVARQKETPARFIKTFRLKED